MTSVAPLHAAPTAVIDVNRTSGPLRGDSDTPATAAGLVELTQAADTDHALACGLAGYLRAVARTAGVGAEATTSEVSDTATAYLALDQRSSIAPDRDLMLTWSERDGWRIAVETDPDEPPIVLAGLGDDILPTPHTVAQFVTDLLANDQASCPHSRHISTRRDLSARLSRYRTQQSTL
jgi:hypothetical protein